MAVKTINGRTARLLSLDCSFVDDKASYTRIYQVVTDPTDHQDIALAASDLPAYGSVYTYQGFTDPLAYALEFRTGVKPDGDDSAFIEHAGEKCLLWPVTVVNKYYDSQIPGPPNRNPVLEPPQISGNFITKQFLATRDKNNNPIHNTAFDLIDPLPQGVELGDTIQYKKNTYTISLALRAAASGKVNSAPIWGLAKRQVKLVKWNYDIRYYGGNPYVANSLEFEVSFKEHPVAINQNNTVKGFYHTFPNRGWRGFVTPDGGGQPEKIRLVDGRDVPYTDQKYLDINGFETDVENYVRYELEDEFDFRSFMPNPLPGPFV